MRWRDVKHKKTTFEMEEDSVNYASIADKAKAFVTDSFLLAVPIIYIVIYLIMGGREGFGSNMLMGWVYILVPLCIVVVIFYAKTGQTPGYKAQNLKLIDNKTNEIPNFVLIFLRFWFFIIATISIVGLVVAFFRKDKKALHDILSSTTVIKI